MLPSLSEQATAQFYQWERQGRGWHVFDTPVDLEPTFVPFFKHDTTIVSNTVVDDGKVPGLIGMAVNLVKTLFAKQEQPTPVQEDPYTAYIFECDELIKVISLTLPKGSKVSIEETDRLLLMLSNSQYPVSFEIVASSVSITLQFACREPDAPYVQGQTKAYFPDTILQETVDVIRDIVNTTEYAAIADYGLQDEFMRPITMMERNSSDPFIGLFATLEHLQGNEYAVIQVLFKAVVNPWAESIMRSVLDDGGKPFFSDAPDMVPLAKEKVSYPLFGVAMKVMGAAETVDDAISIRDAVGKSFVRIYKNSGNSLIPLDGSYPFEKKVADMVFRESHRVGMLLNSRELATIVHLPSDAVIAPKLKRNTRKTKAAPTITEGHALVLGINEHQGKTKNVTVSSTQRLKHTHVIGATGTGKSTFLQRLIAEDIANGQGICLIDPHGDLIESLLPYIPENRINDVIVIDPADTEYPVGFNILSAHSEIEKDILSSDLVAIFKRLSTSWGDQMNSVFANAILAILESTQGGTLADLRRFLVEKSFRDTYLKTVSDPSIVYYWQKEFPLLKSGSIGPILTRLDTFLRPKLIRNMVTQNKGLDFEKILDERKIVLVKLSQGLIGNENSYLLGTFFVTKIYQAAMARQMKSKEARTDYFLYIDEFQNFITPSISLILAGARKYALGLVLAHQDMQQLVKYDSELASAVTSNAGTRVCFRLGDTDAKRFASGFSFFEAQDLENLNTGEAICRIERPDYDFSLSTIPLEELELSTAESTRQSVISRSRAQYSTPRAEVEMQLHEDMDIKETRPEQPKPEQHIPTHKLPVIQAQIQPLSEDAITKTKEKFTEQKAQSEHRYLQTLLKNMAESRGYVARIEEPTPDGRGRVDVHLERNGRKIACEVCSTTGVEWELHNIEKCLAAGYDLIVECSYEKRTLENIRTKVQSHFDTSVLDKILVLDPDAFIAFLDQEMAKEASTEKRIKGFRVKVDYTPVSGEESEQNKKSVMKAINDAMKKKKK